jgi:hypothetical protein
MTSLEQFLSKDKKVDVVINEPASGSFQCQDNECKEITYDGYIDRMHNRIHWTCSNGHDSSVVI